MDAAVLDELRSVSFAISRRIPSNDERTTACGVSSMMKSTPVRFSRARMLRPRGR
jgi:hypothetical protein